MPTDQPSGSAATPKWSAALPKPLPPHLFTQGFVEDQFVVMEYVEAVGWWRRVGNYRDRIKAVEDVRTLSNTGTAAVVLRQQITQGPMSFVMSSLPDEGATDE